MKRWHKALLVIVAAAGLSTVGIQASDVLRNVDGNMLGLALESGSPCGEESTQVNIGSGTLCVDLYEASPSHTCPNSDPNNELQTQENINNFDCAAVSVSGVVPWRYVSLQQAQQLCARAGKRLPNNDEWYALVSAMGDQSTCKVSGTNPMITGAAACTTHVGIHDLVGNLWEWVDAEVVNGQYNGRRIPESGYVQLVDADGIVLETGIAANDEYGRDYAVTDLEGVYGMIRGGFYGSGEDAGLYAQNLAVPLDLKASGVGFRCVKSL